MHDYHKGLPGYDENQILVDGCAECQKRSMDVLDGLANMDTLRFRRAWWRAYEWQVNGLPTLSHAERPILEALRGVMLQFERLGLGPFGTPPWEPGAIAGWAARVAAGS